MRVAVLGTGRLGRSMLSLLPRAGHEVISWSRGAPLPQAELYWVTVSDNAIPEVARLLPPGVVAIHASGLLPPQALRPPGAALPGPRSVGCLHPMQTFPGPERGLPDLYGVHAAIAGEELAKGCCRELALSLGMIPFEIPGDRRLYHAACVLAGNLSALLLVEAAALMARAGIDENDARKMLLPLAQRALENVAREGIQALTGPHARGDYGTIAAHGDALRGCDPAIQELYDALGRRIVELQRAQAEVADPRGDGRLGVDPPRR